MTKILGFSGAKQSGKSTCCKFIHGYQLRLNDVVKNVVKLKSLHNLVNSALFILKTFLPLYVTLSILKVLLSK